MFLTLTRFSVEKLKHSSSLRLFSYQSDQWSDPLSDGRRQNELHDDLQAPEALPNEELLNHLFISRTASITFVIVMSVVLSTYSSLFTIRSTVIIEVVVICETRVGSGRGEQPVVVLKDGVNSTQRQSELSSLKF